MDIYGLNIIDSFFVVLFFKKVKYMRQKLIVKLLQILKTILFICSKASKGWIIEYKGGNKFYFLKKLNESKMVFN